MDGGGWGWRAGTAPWPQAEEADHRRCLAEDAAVAMAAVVGQCARHAWEAAGREVAAAQGLCDAAVEELALLQEGEVAGLRQIATLELTETSAPAPVLSTLV